MRLRASTSRDRATGGNTVARVGVVVGSAAVALALVAGGVVATVATLRPAPGSDGSALTGPGPFAVGQAVRTDIGVVRVTNVESLGGLSAQDLGGANHGIAGLVDADQAQVQVTLRLTNDTGSAVKYSPSQITMRSGSDKAVKAMSSTMPESELHAGSSLEGTLGFVASRTGSSLRLELPGSVEVDLGRTDFSTADPSQGHQH
jgi:hypothetical protein